MNCSGDTSTHGVHLPSPQPLPAPEKEVGEMGEHTVREKTSPHTSSIEQEEEKVAQLAQEHLPLEAKPTEQHIEQHIVEQEEQKTALEQDVDKIRQNQLAQSEQQASAVDKPTSASPPISGSVAIEKTSGQVAVETQIIPSLVPPGESVAPRSLLTRMEEMKVPGVSIAVIDGGKIVWSDGYGDLDERSYPGILTQAASVSKVVTALTVLSLCNDHILSLDQDVGALFRDRLGPEGETLWKKIYPKDSAESGVHKVTIRHLLSHTSGIPAGGSEYYSLDQLDRQFMIDLNELEQNFSLLGKSEYVAVKASIDALASLLAKRKSAPGKEIEDDISHRQKEILSSLASIGSTLSPEQVPLFDERLSRLNASQICRNDAVALPMPNLDQILQGEDKKLGPIQVKREPGKLFEYSNPGFTVLQKIVEIASGNDFAFEVQKRVLNPLGMKDSYYTPPIERTVRGNDTDGKPLPESWRLLPHKAAGGLWTSAEDLAKIVLAIQGARANVPLEGSEKPLICQQLAQEMERGTEASYSKSYGLGLGFDKDAGYFAHNGTIRGFRTLLIANDRGQGAVILTNSNNGEDLYPEIVASIAKAYNWPNRNKLAICEPRVKPEQLYTSPQEASDPSNKAIWAKRVGTYECVDNGKHYYVDVSVQEDGEKVRFQAYEVNESGKIEEGAITCIPIGPSVALHSPDAQGPLDTVNFITKGDKTHVNIFGGQYTRLPAESLLFSNITGEQTIPGMPSGPFTIEDRMKQLNVPGVGITILKGGKVLWEKGYGELAAPSGEPRVLSQAASMSKTVTALTVLSLIEQCRRKSRDGQRSGLAKDLLIDLDTDIKDIFTAILGKEETESLWKKIDSTHLSEKPGHAIKIRHLLSHTGGFGKGGAPYSNKEGLITQIQQIEQEIAIEGPSDTHSPLKQRLAVLQDMYKEAGQEQLPSTDDILEGRSKLGKIEIISQPGTHYEYSNKGIAILQKLVELLTQKSFAEAVEERVLDPLEMHQTTYTSPALEEAAKGHDEEGHPIPGMWVRIPELAAGGLWTTSMDFGKVVEEIQKALHGESQLVGSELAHEMIADQVPLPHEGTDSYGLGVYIQKLPSEEQSVTYFSHSGRSPGFHNYMIGNDRGDGAIIMTNSESGEILDSEILKSIADAYEWPAADMLEKCRPLLSPEEISPPSTETIEKWAARVQGTYKYWENGEDRLKRYPDHIVEIRFDEGSRKIYADIDGGSTQKGGKTVELLPGGDRFATYLKTPPGLYAICDFSTSEGNSSPEAPFTHHNLFGLDFVRELQ